MEIAGPVPQTSREHSCLTCGYILDGLTEPRCPECGRAFDPTNPITFRGRHGNAATFILWTTPPGWMLNGACIVAALASLIAVSAPGGYMGVMLVLLLAWLVLLAMWGVRGLAAVFLLADRRWYGIEHKRSQWNWLVLPVVIGCTVLLMGLDVPMRVCFWLSRTTMERMAVQVVNTPGRYAPPSSGFGAFPIAHVNSENGRVYFEVSGTGIMELNAFVYCPTGPPPRISSEETYSHLEDQWYVWSEEF